MTPPTRDYLLRRCIFSPYRKGMGPVFYLVTWDTNRVNSMGKYLLGYRLTMRDKGKLTLLFKGEDFGCSPLHAIDSDETIVAIMGFLTLRPGDTDDEYFLDYTKKQLDYCSQHAEALAGEVMNRFVEHA